MQTGKELRLSAWPSFTSPRRAAKPMHRQEFTEAVGFYGHKASSVRRNAARKKPAPEGRLSFKTHLDLKILVGRVRCLIGGLLHRILGFAERFLALAFHLLNCTLAAHLV